MSETPGFENRCEKTLNEGRHVCLQMRGHEGECRANVNAPWPPVPATPLDVEACAGLLAELANNPDFYRLHPRTAALLSALASALPGMGKDSEDAARYRFVKRYLRVETDDGSMSEFLFMDDALCSEDTVAEGFDNTVDSLIDQAIAARAAQPEETSADG